MLAELAESLGFSSDIGFVGINGSIEGGTTTFLGCHGARPVLAVKIARHSAAGRRLAAESAMLNRLASASVDVSGKIPRVIAFRPDIRYGVLTTSIVAGRPMSVKTTSDGRLDPSAANREFRQAPEWLAAFQATTRSTDQSVREKTRQRLIATAAEFRETFRLNSAERQVVDAMADKVDEQLAAGVVAEHGDFCRQNLLWTSGEGLTGVIDWTFGRDAGLPLNDLFYFFALYFIQARRAPGRSGLISAFEEALLDVGPTAESINDRIGVHARQFGIDPGIVDRALAWMIVERCVFDARLFAECRKRDAVPRWMLALANDASAAPDDAGGHQFWITIFSALVSRRGGRIS